MHMPEWMCTLEAIYLLLLVYLRALPYRKLEPIHVSGWGNIQGQVLILKGLSHG